MASKYIFNYSSLLMEAATKEKCPRCRGFGGVIGDDDNCDLCDGYGWVWRSHSGWTLKPYGKVKQDEKLY